MSAELQNAHKALNINEEEVTIRLVKLTTAWLNQCLVEDDKGFASAALATIALMRDDYERMRQVYVNFLDTAMEDATAALGQPESATEKLENIAGEIRNKEISPSFSVLDETLSRYHAVQARLSGIAFT